jgi:hypothetical protein
VDERLQGIPAADVLNRFPAEERLKGLSVDELRNALPAEVLAELVRLQKTNEERSQT